MDPYLLVVTASSLYWYTGTARPIAASPHESPLVIETLLYNLLDSLIDSQMERAVFERAALRKE